MAAAPLKAGHTPTPWRVVGRKTHHIITADALENMPGQQLAICKLDQWNPGVGPTARDQAANAAYIVRACNSHDNLVAALEWYANPEIYKAHPHGPAFDDRDLSFHARAALAAAKE